MIEADNSDKKATHGEGLYQRDDFCKNFGQRTFNSRKLHFSNICAPQDFKYQNQVNLQIFMLGRRVDSGLVQPERFTHQSLEPVPVNGERHVFLCYGKSCPNSWCSVFSSFFFEVTPESRTLNELPAFENIRKNGIAAKDFRFMKCVVHTRYLYCRSTARQGYNNK